MKTSEGGPLTLDELLTPGLEVPGAVYLFSDHARTGRDSSGHETLEMTLTARRWTS
jgi:hypothetical protein